MGWAVGYDTNWRRDVGYGVPAVCDHPECCESIDRGLAYVCGGEPYGGEDGCGLHFCYAHLLLSAEEGVPQQCVRCAEDAEPFEPSPDTAEWVEHKLTSHSGSVCGLAKLTKRDVVLTDGQRFRRDRLSRSGPSTWSPTVYLRGPNDADALSALTEGHAWQVLARLDRELRPLRKPGDRTDPAAAVPAVRRAVAALERLIEGGPDDR